MVVMAIAGLMVGVGYTGFSAVQKRERVSAAASLLVSHLKEARMMATEKHQSHRVLFSGSQYTVCPWDGVSDFNTASNPIVRQVSLAQEFPGVAFSTPPTNFRFDIKGLPRNAGGGFLASSIVMEDLDARRCTVTISSLGRAEIDCVDL
jgi:Tfp pilus assembly protein FimT